MTGTHFFAEKKTAIFLFLLLLGGIVITFSIYIHENSKHIRNLKHDFSNDAQLFTQVINNAVKSQITFAKTTQSFFLASDFVTENEFKVFTKLYVDSGKGISAAIWAPAVKQGNLKKFETEAAAELKRDFQIRDLSGYGQSKEVSSKNIYYPVLYMVSENPLSMSMLGYDMNILDCFPGYTSLIASSGEPLICVCSHLQKLFPFNKNYLLITPVPDKTASAEKGQLAGIIIMIIDIEKMIKDLTGSLPLESISFDIYSMKGSEKRLLFSSNGNTKPVNFKEMETVSKIADSNLSIHIYPEKNYIRKYLDSQDIVVIPLGIILTLLLLLFTKSMLEKEKHAKKQIAERTRELETALELKNSIFNNHAAGLIITSENLEITEINDNACIILGYLPEEINSKSISILYKSETAFADFARNLQTSESVVSAELELIKKDGSMAWCFISVNPIKQQDTVMNIWIVHDITEKKRIENKIMEQEENIKIFFDASASLIFIINKNMDILYSNNTAEEKTNYTKTELHNLKITDLYNDDCRKQAETEFLNIIGGQKDNCSLSISTKNNKMIPVNSKTVSGKWGGEDVFFVLYNDISGIEEEHRKFEKAFQSNPTPMLISSIENGEIIEINDSFSRLFLYDKKELIGRETSKILYVYPEERFKIVKQIEKDGCLKNYYVEFQDKSGDKKDILLNVEIVNISGRDYFLSSLIDMTAFRRAEQSLKESEERWKFALEGSGDGIWDWEVNSNYLFYSARAKALLGYESNELEGSYNDFLSRLHPDDKIHTLNSLQMYLDGKTELYQSEHRLRCNSGSYIWVLVKGKTILYDEAGNPKRIIGTLTDISWHKQIENELRSARTEADSANQAKSRFLANMSHEIRTPLHGIIGLTELVLTTLLTENQRKYIENLKTSAYSLLDILNEVLDIAKIESGKFKPAEVDFDIYSLIEKSVTIFGAKCLEKEIDLILDMRPDFPDMLTGDAVRIRQIISNLLSNAVKFTHNGEIILSVKKSPVQSLEHNKLFVDFSVKDTGIGIPADKIAHIFDSFNQVDDSITRNYGGTGLGLTISRNLADMMGGKLTVSSVEKEGSTFTLSIPLFIRNSETKAWSRKPKYKKVLIVDSNEVFLDVLADIMNAFRIDCTISNNAEDAMTLFNLAYNGGIPYDLLLIDTARANHESIRMIKDIRSTASAKPVRIVPFISMITETNQAELEILKISRFLVKPVKLTDLYNVLTTEPNNQATDSLSMKSISLDNINCGKYKIMVVEDNAINTLVIIDILKNMGLDTVSAANGPEAIRKYSQEKIDLIFMDIHMPGMDGFELTRKIRNSESPSRNIPIIALSADTRKDEIEKSLKEGMNHYICKPFSISDIAEAINKFLPLSGTVQLAPQSPKVKVVEDSTVFDRETFMLMINNNEETYRKLISMAKKEIPMIENAISAALRKNNYHDIILYSHELKGISSNLRAIKLLDTAKDIEEKSKDARPLPEIIPLAEKLPGLFSQFITLAEQQMPPLK